MNRPDLQDFPLLRDRYELEQALGHGGFGEVWKARDRQLERVVAIKFLHPREGRPLEAERWRGEALALARLQHPSVVTIHDFELSTRGDTAAALVLSWVDGTPLSEKLTPGPIAESQALAWLRDLADGLTALHRAGLIHRDLKPENILIEKDSGRAIIIDLGAAIRQDADWATRLTRTNESIGSVGYMPPEQMRPGYEPDARTDQFALAVIFYQMLAGHLPAGRFEPLAARGLCDQATSEAVNRALSSDPANRFPSVAAFAAAVLDKRPNRLGSILIPIVIFIAVTAVAVPVARKHFTPGKQAAIPGNAEPPARTSWREIDRFQLAADDPSSIFRLAAGADRHLVAAGSFGGMMSGAGWRDGPKPSWIRSLVPEAVGGVVCDLAVLGKGDLVMAGWIDGGAGVWRDFVVSRVDRATGETRWLFRKEGGLGRNDMAHGLAVSPDGRHIAAAGFVHGGRHRQLRSHVVLLDADDGTVVWETDPDREGGDSLATSIRFLPDGDLVVTGQMVVEDRMYEAFVSRLDGSNGDFRWTRTYGAEGHLTNDIALAAESGRGDRILVLSACGVHEGTGQPALACIDPDQGSMIWLEHHEEGMPTGFIVGPRHILATRTQVLAGGQWETLCTASDPETGGTRITWTLAQGTDTPMAADVTIDAQGTCWIATGTPTGTVVVRKLSRGDDLDTVLEIDDLAWPLHEAKCHEGFLLRRRMLAADGSLWLTGPSSPSASSKLEVVRLGPTQN